MVLNSDSPWLAHAAQNIFLILLSLAFLPLDLTILFLSYAIRYFFYSGNKPGVLASGEAKKTILVTGVGMTKGLALARAFYQAGHRVIGADFEPGFACGRFSTALSGFYTLRKPTTSSSSSGSSSSSKLYVQDLINVIVREHVDLWVSCSGVASAVEDGEAKEMIEQQTNCKAVQFNVRITQMLHEKHTFVEHTKQIGLHVPETHTITSREQVEHALQQAAPGRKYILKTIGMNDAARGEILSTLLPKETPHATKKYLATLHISPQSPWILQQFILGQEFCTHALVIRGKVCAFVACPSAELLMHYRALPADSALSQAMLQFTRTYAAAEGETFTGHLSFDFLVEGDDTDTTTTTTTQRRRRRDPREIVLYPIECNPRAHTAVCLLTNRNPDMIHAYLELLNETPNENNNNPEHLATTPTPTTPKEEETNYYWIGHDLLTLLFNPFLSSLTTEPPPPQHPSFFSFFSFFFSPSFYRAYKHNLLTFLSHVLTWKDGTYEIWDPLPWFALYHVYWPLRFAMCLVKGTRWSRVNVSTTKMFEC
ncbi:uncharacterized protein SEPMUDRAFT_52401 [Sphaerulina musiva SO2202]|uniref:ATP-grasp domain-containing protein n=1 Tax=Sphaerulina musiva (strain SO2202) TaxID=692275 RepID=M3CAU2_SPHMS|nr:uncharacterized protein SEPMUDRAFT_52401 [Sphaerulina musiva SO2202]EMF08930.1 hypothetical protein SEPMUDRAFT_52401 [Sphaerulina musiva SO2202]